MADSSSEPVTAASGSPDAVVDFWRQAGPDRWFKRDEAFDRDISQRFLALHAEAAAGHLDHWSDNATGSLALILVLDQFSRNLLRGSAKAFAQDSKALGLARQAVSRGLDQQIEDRHLRCFFYLPFEHSESLCDQRASVLLFHPLGDANYLQYALLHLRIIERFGRFPHRNDVLGRHTSPAEQAFLDSGGFSG